MVKQCLICQCYFFMEDNICEECKNKRKDEEMPEFMKVLFPDFSSLKKDNK